MSDSNEFFLRAVNIFLIDLKKYIIKSKANVGRLKKYVKRLPEDGGKNDLEVNDSPHFSPPPSKRSKVL